MKEYNKETEAYTNLLMKCVSDSDFFDESLVKYLLNYKRDIIDGYHFYDRKPFGVVKSDLWGYVKSKSNNDDITKWAILLNKDLKKEPVYQYLKFNFSDREKRDKKAEYKPLYFKGYGKTERYLEVSPELLKVTTEFSKEKIIYPENLSEIEMKLIINDLLNDNNIHYSTIIRKENHEKLINKIKDFIINNYEEMENLAKEDKKSIIRLIGMGNNIIKIAFQSIVGEERENFLKKHNLEEKYITYMRYKDVDLDFLVECIETYKDKNFWIKNLNCYCKKENTFSIKNAIKDILIIKPILYENQSYNMLNFYKGGLIKLVDESIYGEKYKIILNILNFFKEELKGASNYKEEMEKFIIAAIIEKNHYLYKTIKKFMIKENGYQEDMDFKSPLYIEVVNKNEGFLNEIKEEDIKELNNKLLEKLEEKNQKMKKMKI